MPMKSSGFESRGQTGLKYKTAGESLTLGDDERTDRTKVQDGRRVGDTW